MKDAPDPEREPAGTPYLRVPLPVAAAVLFIFLAALLAVGLYANRNLRPQGIFVPTPAAQPAPTATPPPLAAAPIPTATAPALVATTAPTPLILVMPTPTASPAPPTLSPTSAPAATESPTTLPTVEPALAAEVGKAYENFWRVRSQAELTLDSSQLPEVMNGPYLEHFVEVLNQLKAEDKAVKIHVVLNYTVVQAANESAIVHDYIEDTSFFVELGTDTALSDPTNDLLRIEFSLARLDGKWKVVDSVRES